MVNPDAAVADRRVGEERGHSSAGRPRSGASRPPRFRNVLCGLRTASGRSSAGRGRAHPTTEAQPAPACRQRAIGPADVGSDRLGPWPGSEGLAQRRAEPASDPIRPASNAARDRRCTRAQIVRGDEVAIWRRGWFGKAHSAPGCPWAPASRSSRPATEFLAADKRHILAPSTPRTQIRLADIAQSSAGLSRPRATLGAGRCGPHLDPCQTMCEGRNAVRDLARRR